MIDCLSIVETDKVIHTVETDMVKLVVEIEIFAMNFDEFDKETRSSDGLQPNQADLSYVHALNELDLHETHLVPSTHKADQFGRLSAPKRITLLARVVIEKFEWVTKKNLKKRGNGGEPNRDRNVRDENKRTRNGNAFATTTNPVRRGGPGHMAKDCKVAPRMVSPMNSRNPTAAPGACYECGGTNHFKAACPRLNQAQKPRGNRPNQVVANNGGQGRGNNGNQASGRAFILGAEEAHQDPNIMTSIEPNELGFNYEIEIASGQLVETDKVIRGYKLEIEDHMFDINLILFGSGGFDVII
nr:hypothetical protein [Tanacetum cinerariifolium]